MAALARQSGGESFKVLQHCSAASVPVAMYIQSVDGVPDPPVGDRIPAARSFPAVAQRSNGLVLLVGILMCHWFVFTMGQPR